MCWGADVLWYLETCTTAAGAAGATGAAAQANKKKQAHTTLILEEAAAKIGRMT